MESMDSPSALVTSDESSHTTLSETANINTSQVTNGTSGVNPSTFEFLSYLFSNIHYTTVVVSVGLIYKHLFLQNQSDQNLLDSLRLTPVASTTLRK